MWSRSGSENPNRRSGWVWVLILVYTERGQLQVKVRMNEQENAFDYLEQSEMQRR
jgi:hypothetical protein